MDDGTFIACYEACVKASRSASRQQAEHQDCMRRCREQLALARKLLAMPVYPHDYVPPHNPFDFRELKVRMEAAAALTTWIP